MLSEHRNSVLILVIVIVAIIIAFLCLSGLVVGGLKDW
jgi:hypothetical protein